MIYVQVESGEYKGWRGVLNGIIRKSEISADNVVSVNIAPPPEFRTLTEVYLPQGSLVQLK